MCKYGGQCWHKGIDCYTIAITCLHKTISDVANDDSVIVYAYNQLVVLVVCVCVCVWPCCFML